MQDLCFHSEYIEPFREELEVNYGEFERTAQGLPLLDSFIKESARLTPVESSMEYFTLSPSKLAYLDNTLLTAAVSTRRYAL